MDNENKDILSKEIGVLKECSFAEKETTARINNIKGFKELIESDDEKAKKEDRENFDRSIRERQINLQETQHDWDKEKFERQQEFDREKMNNAHEERMAELKNEQSRIENESKKIENDAKKAEEEANQRKLEFKKQRRREWLQFGIKCLLIVGTVGVNVALHASEIRLEQKYNGITPKRCGTYDKAIESIANAIVK